MIASPGRIRVRLKLQRTGARKAKATSDGPAKISQNTKKVTVVELSGSRDKLTQDMNWVRCQDE